MIACMGRLGARESSERQMGRCARILAGVYVPPYMVCVAQVWRPKDRVSWTRTGKLGACSLNEKRSRQSHGRVPYAAYRPPLRAQGLVRACYRLESEGIRWAYWRSLGRET